ncbi:ankyrin repeat domain-containing protein [Paraburkholderia dilworthii]|uniref:Ankyrin repeat-containing protein n=1 Tax=Paraburkholderia dilworthii TaxID=948106 RepID=A0ABW9D6K4_9BURK
MQTQNRRTRRARTGRLPSGFSNDRLEWLLSAASRGDFDTVKSVYGSCAWFPTLPSVVGEGGITPLMLAARRGHADIVGYLIANGMDIHAEMPNQSGDPVTALDLARVCNGRLANNDAVIDVLVRASNREGALAEHLNPYADELPDGSFGVASVNVYTKELVDYDVANRQLAEVLKTPEAQAIIAERRAAYEAERKTQQPA